MPSCLHLTFGYFQPPSLQERVSVRRAIYLYRSVIYRSIHLSTYQCILLPIYPSFYGHALIDKQWFLSLHISIYTYVYPHIYIYKHVTLCKPSSVSITANCNLFTRRREPWRLDTLTDFFACQATYIALFRTPLFRTTSEDKKGPVGQNTCCKH